MRLQFSFLPIPEELMKSKALSFGAKFLFGIYGKANKEKVKWSARYLAKRMGCEVREARNRKAELIKNNLIVVRPRKGRVDEVSINFELISLVQEETPAQTDRGVNEQEGAVQNEQGGAVRNGQGNSKEPSLKKTIKEREILTPSEEMNLFLKDGEYFYKIVDSIVNKGMPREPARMELLKFRSYWTERNKSGTKQRWEMERTFELKRRLVTWFRNADKFSPKGQSKKIGIAI